MIIYRANVHRYSPEQSKIEKVRVNKKDKKYTVLESKELPDAYYYIIGKKNIKECLNKEFFESI